MARTILTYYIVLTDAAAVTANQALYPSGVIRAPYNAGPPPGGAAIEFNAPFRGYTEPAASEAPFIWTPWNSDNEAVFPINVATFTRKSGGFWGIGGKTTTYVWVGQFILAPQTTPPVSSDGGIAIPQRRWVEGFGIPGSICGLATSLRFSRDASRHTDGYGLALRGGSTSTLVPLTTFAGLGTPVKTWDRFYLRWRNAGSAAFPFIRWGSNPSPGAGVAVSMMPTGQLALENISSTNVRTLLGTYFQTVLGRWHKVDVITRFNNGAGSASGTHAKVTGSSRVEEPGIASGVVDGVSTLIMPGGDSVTGGGPFVITAHDTLPSRAWVVVAGDLGVLTPPPTGQAPADDPVHVWTTGLLGGGAVRLFVDGLKVADVDVLNAAGGIGANSQTLAQISLGNVCSVTSDDTELDFADWVSSEVPVDAAGNEALFSVDFLQGSKVKVVHPAGFGGAHANWAGDVRVLEQQAVGSWTTKQLLTSSTSGAVIEATTDYAQAIGQDPQALGAVAMQVTLQSLRGGAPSGTLGYQIDAAAAVDAAITQTASMAPNAVMYRPNLAALLPPAITTVRLRHTKAADATAAQVATLLAQVELVGVFFDEDRPIDLADPKPVLPGRVGIHNAPYDRSPWGMNGLAAPNAPVILIGGTYTGNGTGQDLSFRAPVHWFFVRPAAGAQPGGLWWTSMLTPHRNTNLGVEPFYAVQALEDQTFTPPPGEDAQQQRYLVRIAGSDAQANQAAVVYQYIAVCDPGARFLLNAADAHNAALGTVVSALVNAAFTPEWAFFAFEDLSNTSTAFLGVKGPGHATESLTRFNGTTITSALSFGAGTLTGKNALWSIVSALQTAWSLWRRHDGNHDPGEAAVLAIGSYDGDGTASRTITAGTAGKRPLFAIFQPENANAIVRDPSHTGTTSQVLAGGTANASTGITGGAPDSVSVGSVLNGSGVKVHYFILWGGTTACNGGWSCNGEYFPVEAAPPVDGPWPSPPLAQDDTATTAPDTPVLVDVLANDAPDLTLTAVSTPAHGTAAVVGGQVLYTPASGFTGTDTFTYTVTDGTVSDSATVTVTVTAGGGGGGEEPDLTPACVGATQRLVNIALSRIGVSKVIADLAAENTMEAALARLHVKTDVEACLADFNWPFATRYVNLVLVAGSEAAPATVDWVYSYRAPADMVAARRLGGQAQQRRHWDPDPIKFRTGSDATGALIYCNAAASATVPLTLEYTARLSCPASSGPPLFKDALAWRFAASLAMPLARDPQRQATCLAMYERVLGQAEAAAAAEQQQDPSGDAPWITGRN